LELLQELVPKVAVIAVLVNPTFVSAEKETQDALAAGRALGKQVHIVTASSEGEIDTAFGDLVKHRAGALMVALTPSSLPAASILLRWQRNTQFPRSIFRVSSPRLAV
jgi:hypothetical protein